jgi:hypothetical protein
MRFSLKTSKQMYCLEIRRTIRSITANVWPQAQTYGVECDIELYFCRPSHNYCFLILELCLELMICLFLVFEVIELQRNYMEEFYDSCEYKLTWMLYYYFPALHTYFIYIKHAYFVTLMKYILELLGTLFCENVCRLIR